MKTNYRVDGKEKGKGESWLEYSQHRNIGAAQKAITYQKEHDKVLLVKGYRYRTVKVTEEIVK